MYAETLTCSVFFDSPEHVLNMQQLFVSVISLLESFLIWSQFSFASPYLNPIDYYCCHGNL
jgi:nitrate/nitrite transporter NarK